MKTPKMLSEHAGLIGELISRHEARKAKLESRKNAREIRRFKYRNLINTCLQFITLFAVVLLGLVTLIWLRALLSK